MSDCLPDALPAERALISLAIIHTDLAGRAVELVDPADIFSSKWRGVFRAISRIVERGDSPETA